MTTDNTTKRNNYFCGKIYYTRDDTGEVKVIYVLK